MTAFCSVAVITLGVSLLGLWQANRLGAALYEVGVVRLPSIEGLTQIVRAKAALDGSARALVLPGDSDTTVASELDRQARAWERAARGWALYEPLPQTADEATTWKAFVPAWNAWKTDYSAGVSLLAEGDRSGNDALRTRGQQALGAAANLSLNVDALLANLTAINDQAAAGAMQNSVASPEDLTRVRNLMLLGGLLSVLGATAAGFLLGRRLSRPLVHVAANLARVADGGPSPPLLTIDANDEIGQIAKAVNSLIDRQRATEAGRLLADERRQKSEEKFSKVFMSAPVGIGVTDLADGRLRDVNAELERLLGYSRDELIGRTSAELQLWGDPNDRHAIVDRIQAGGEVHDLEVGLRRSDGRIVPVRYAGQQIQFDGVALLLSAFVDLTDAKKAEGALKKSEEKFSKVFMSAPVGIAVTGLDDARIVESNDEFLRLLRYNREDVIGRTSTELGIWPDPKTRDVLVAALRAGGVSSSEEQLRAKDGEIRTVRAATHRIDLDGAPFILSAVVDVTDQRRAEAERRHSDRLYRELVDGARDVIFAVTPDGVLTALNPAFEQVLGWRREQWLGESFVGLVAPDDVPQALTLFHAALQSEPSPITQLRTRTADGKVRIAEIYLSAQRESDRVVGVLGIARDVTDRTQLEEQFHQAQKMEAIGRLAGGVAHDFNNLLTAILGYCELLLVDVHPGHPQRDDITEIQKAGLRAAALTRQLLAFSRKQIIEPTTLALNAIVADIRPMLGRLIGEDVSIVLQLHPELGSVKADHGQVEQVILNLAVNARDAMPEGGTLTIRTVNVEVDEDADETVAGAKPGSYVALTVSDTGMGMTPEVRARLFEPFFTTKGVGKGTGLGLATVQGIVLRSGGSVGIDSEVGKGTSFHIYFPRVDPVEALTEDAAPSIHRPQIGGETILVVEDSDGLRQLATRLLQRHGYKVLVAADAAAAIKVFDEHASIDVLLTDVVMPGASGPELTRQLVEKRPALKVIYMSGYTEETIVHHGVLNPGIAFLNKPFSSEALGMKIREVLEGGAAAIR
ncbi:MAG TPA: PAS domain S-box protein [Vicinamibacterales bacterium]|nr:PAS domain S-box protein [Vicinamibacterales bacterium]